MGYFFSFTFFQINLRRLSNSLWIPFCMARRNALSTSFIIFIMTIHNKLHLPITLYMYGTRTFTARPAPRIRKHTTTLICRLLWQHKHIYNWQRCTGLVLECDITKNIVQCWLSIYFYAPFWRPQERPQHLCFLPEPSKSWLSPTI